MKTMLITGGTDGIGKGMALHYLTKGYDVIAVGSSINKGERLLEDARNMGKESQLTFIQADLSLVKENLRVVKLVSDKVDALDGLVLCAASLKPQKSYTETQEHFEFTFALYYLSRYVLCYQLKNLLEKAKSPVIINVCAPGMSGKVNWDDIQMQHNYNGQNAQFHGSRLNDLLGVSFTQKDNVKKVSYLLFNPMAARTPGAAKMGEGNPFMKLTMKLYYKFCGKDVSEIVKIIDEVTAKVVSAQTDSKVDSKAASNTNSKATSNTASNTTSKADSKAASNATSKATSMLSAYKLNQPVDLNGDTFNIANAEKLDHYTEMLLEKLL